MESDDDNATFKKKGLFTETSFNDIEQKVEKSIIDLFGIS
jgi:hypothetical protein